MQNFHRWWYQSNPMFAIFLATKAMLSVMLSVDAEVTYPISLSCTVLKCPLK